ncbi:MAG: hypothetical protein EPO21_04920 [Chloroflexota bacterium]|nr:MAG: hypothetical protein EPO21_04920 [Chloroflexota bacterium]
MTTISTPYQRTLTSSVLTFLESRRRETYLLAAVVLVAFLMRLAFLVTVPPNVTADEADNLVNVYHILEGQGPGLFGLDWKPAPAFSVHLMALFMLIFGKTIFAMRLASVALSTVALIPMYFVARRHLSITASLISTILMSTGVWYFHFSRSGWENIHIVLYELMAIWMLELALARGQRRFYAASGFFAALGLYGYFSGRIVIVLLLLYLPFALWQRRVQARQILLGYAVLVTVTVVAFAPQLPTIVKQWDYFNRRTASVSALTTTEPVYGTTDKAVVLWNQVERTVRAFVLMDATLDGNTRYKPPARSLFDPITSSLFVVGLVLAAVRWRKMALWLLLFGLPLLVVQIPSLGVPDGARAIGLIPAVYLFCGLTFDKLIARPRLARGVFQISLLILTPVVVLSNIGAYAEWMREPEATAARQPAVDNADFPLWQELQLERARAGQPGFVVNEWQQMRGNLPALAAKIAPSTSSKTIKQPTNIPGDLATFVAAFGRQGSGNGEFLEPRAVAADRDGSLYVVDTGNKRIVRLDANLQPQLAWGRSGEGNGEFTEPWAVATDNAGFVYVLDAVGQSIQRFDSSGKYLSRLGSDLGMYRPRDMTIDGDGFFYIADTGRNRIVKIGREGQIVKTYGAPERNNPALDQPTSALADAQGNLYVAEPTKKRVLKLDPDGRMLLQWEIPPANTRDAPRLRLGPEAQILLTDPTRQRIEVYSSDGVLLGYWGTGGLGDGQFQGALSAAAGANGSIYVADPGNNRVQRFQLK